VPYEIEELTVPSMSLAAVRRRVRPGAVATTWRPALDLVWVYVRGHDGLWTGGHNVFVYHQPDQPDDLMMVDFGVQVAGPFEGDGIVQPTQTPAGRVASTLHVGPVSGIGGAHEAIEAWRAAHGEVFAGVSWETYGDPGDDPAAFDVRVTYLLR
jgi:hypothetical protein